MSQEWARDIHDMHLKFGFHARTSGEAGVDFSGDFLRFRQRFLEEEMQELDQGILDNDSAKVVDALIDLCVVAIGTLDLGIGRHNTELAWNEVLRANMSKERRENPTRHGSGGFDLIKPDGWKGPNYSKVSMGQFPRALREILDGIAADMATEGPSTQFHETRLTPSHILRLEEWVNFAKSKNQDYNDDEEDQHATYYVHGIDDILYEIRKKVKRLNSLFKKVKAGGKPQTDSITDSFRDIGIYSAIGATYWDGQLEGQDPTRDQFNRKEETYEVCNHFIGHIVDDGRAARLSDVRPGLSVMWFKHCPDCGRELKEYQS